MNHRTDRVNQNTLRILALVWFGGLLPLSGVAQTIVWTDINGRRIQSKSVNGGPVETVVQFQAPQNAGEIHYDPIEKKFYYRSSSFWRINLDGSNPEPISTPSSGRFALGLESRRLYWMVEFAGVLHYSALDGTESGSHAYPSCCVISPEVFRSDVFFGAGGTMQKGVWRAEEDGSNELFLTVTPQPFDLAYDSQEEKIYVATADNILRLSADGSDVVAQVIQQLDAPADHVEVDVQSRKVYWASRQSKVIRRCNLDGTNVEDFVTALDVGNPNFEIRGLTIVGPPRVPALSTWGFVVSITFILTAGTIVQKMRHNVTARI